MGFMWSQVSSRDVDVVDRTSAGFVLMEIKALIADLKLRQEKLRAQIRAHENPPDGNPRVSIAKLRIEKARMDLDLILLRIAISNCNLKN
jgi:hypothetical protein